MGVIGSEFSRGRGGQSHIALAASVIWGSVGWSHQYLLRSCIWMQTVCAISWAAVVMVRSPGLVGLGLPGEAFGVVMDPRDVRSRQFSTKWPGRAVAYR